MTITMDFDYNAVQANMAGSLEKIHCKERGVEKTNWKHSSEIASKYAKVFFFCRIWNITPMHPIPDFLSEIPTSGKQKWKWKCIEKGSLLFNMIYFYFLTLAPCIIKKETFEAKAKVKVKVHGEGLLLFNKIYFHFLTLAPCIL